MADYFRADQAQGITPPNLANRCSLAEHVVRARGKKTAYTSVSLSSDVVRTFGGVLYQLNQADLATAGHVLIEHSGLMARLRQEAINATKDEKTRAAVALRYAKRWQEGVVDWQFNTVGVDRKDLVNWAGSQVQCFFTRR